MKQIGLPRDEYFLREFLETLEPLDERLACLLIQFPPYRERDDEGLERLLARIPSHFRCALEFRHESWWSREVEEMVAGLGATVCLSDTEGAVPDRLLAGPFGYVRLRAPNYSNEDRDGWRMLLEREAASRDVYAFAKHKDVPANDPHTGAGFAEWLVSRGTCS